MEVLIREIVSKLHSLPEAKVLEVLHFVDVLAENKEHPPVQQEIEEFEAIAERLADEFQTFVGNNVPRLSDDAVSRAGIYEEHP